MSWSSVVDAFTDITAMTPLHISNCSFCHPSTPQDSLSTDQSFHKLVQSTQLEVHLPHQVPLLYYQLTHLRMNPIHLAQQLQLLSGLAPTLPANPTCASVADGSSSAPSRDSGVSPLW